MGRPGLDADEEDAVDESLCAGCLQQRSQGLFKSDRGALSAKDERETLLTTRSSSEKFLFSVVLTSGVVESVIELFI